MLRTQILAQKWLMENDPHGRVLRHRALGRRLDRLREHLRVGQPRRRGRLPRRRHPLGRPRLGRPTTPTLRRLEAMDFVHAGINARQIAYRKRMMDVADKYPVRFLGEPVFYPGANPALTHTSDGPFGVAGDLMGKSGNLPGGQGTAGFRSASCPRWSPTSSSSISTSPGPRRSSPRPRTSPGRTTWPFRGFGRDLSRGRPAVGAAVALPLRRPA